MRPRIELTAAAIAGIEVMAAEGLTVPMIARVTGISERTLHRRKHDEARVMAALARGRAKAEAAIGIVLLKKAIGGDLAAIIWWEKTRAGRGG